MSAAGEGATTPEREAERQAWRELHRAATTEVGSRLAQTFATLRAPLALPERRLRQRPGPERWSALEVAEHVALASEFLLLLAQRIARRAQRRLARGATWPSAPPDLAGLAAVARDRGRWTHPAHMTPSGARPPAEVAALLDAVLARALALLAAMPAGEGTLHRIRLTVLPGAPRLDLLAWIDFLGRHAERHVAQLRAALAAAEDESSPASEPPT